LIKQYGTSQGDQSCFLEGWRWYLVLVDKAFSELVKIIEELAHSDLLLEHFAHNSLLDVFLDVEDASLSKICKFCEGRSQERGFKGNIYG